MNFVSSKGTIGIPKGLLYYYYYPFFYGLFTSLGFNVASSPPTSKTILDMGIRYAVPEVCIPIKIYLGHICNLLSQNVDYILVPRHITIRKNEWFCPKFMGLPDMVRHSIPGMENKILDIDIKSNSDSINSYPSFEPLLEKLSITPTELKSGLREGEKAFREFRARCEQGYTAKEAVDNLPSKVKAFPGLMGNNLTIGLLGYVYNLYDAHISMDITDKLKSMGINILTFEMLNERDIYSEVDQFTKQMFWSFTNKIWGAGLKFYNNSDIDGIIHVTAFGCGPDAIVGKVLELESNFYNKPFMTIRIDEHSGENHFMTRLEAFVDLLRRKKMKETIKFFAEGVEK